MKTKVVYLTMALALVFSMAAVIVPAERAVAQTSVSIPATQLWVDTGVTVSPGDEINITASGTVFFGDPHNEANTAGPDGKPYPSNCAMLVSDPAVPTHSLVGNIASSSSLDGKGFFVGSSFQGVVPIPNTTEESGKLFLSFNDNCISCDRSGYNSYCWSGDNHGSFTVSITITAGVTDSDGDGIPDIEDPDDDNDGYNDWMEELTGTDPTDENDIPTTNDIESAAIASVEGLELDQGEGKQQSLISKIEKIKELALSDDVREARDAVNQAKALSNRIHAFEESGAISLDDAITITSLAMKLLPTREGVDYEYETRPGYIDHYFKFDRAQMIEMSESCFKAQPYANWVIDEVWTLADGMGSSLGKVIAQVWMACRLSAMANDDLGDPNVDEMWVHVESRSDEAGKWALEFEDKIAGIWKKLTGR